MNLYDFTVKDRTGNDVPLSKYRGKTVLIVNTATSCIFTPQYANLQRLYKEMKSRDFEILDFPCNQFNEQAQGTNEEIHTFCTGRFGVEFEQFGKVDVLGDNADPLFVWLQNSTKFLGLGLSGDARRIAMARHENLKRYDMGPGQICWNFTKFLIGPDGEIVSRFEPPEPVEIIREDVNRLLNGESVSIMGRFNKRQLKDIASESKKFIRNENKKNARGILAISYVVVALFTCFILQVQMWGVMARISPIVNVLIASVVPSLILWLIISLRSKRAEKTTNQLCAALEQASAGNFNYRLKESDNNPLNRAYADYNKMALALKEYTEKMAEAVEQADAANQAKSNFLSNMSHEMRTPLNAVLGMDEMIIRETTEEEIKNYALDIRNAGKSLLSLINDILDLSKIEANKMEIIPVEYDLSSVINDLMNMISEKAKSKGLELKIEVNNHMPHILKGDEIRIKQVCLNILNNAVKYTDEGSVTMRFDYEPKGDKVLLKYSCTDTGQGIKPENMARLFEPFARIEEERNRHVEGTGLGISITKNLLELMGSKLEVESEYGQGSTFSFTVEQVVVRDEEIGDFEESYRKAIANEKQYRESFHAPDAKILVVDDVEMNLTVVKSFLKQTEVSIDTALSGREALALGEKQKYHLIFVDHMMPDMDGFDTLKAFRTGDGPNKDTPIVVLTANAVSGAREEYMNAGFNGYLTKPVESAKLEEMCIKKLPQELVTIKTVSDEDQTVEIIEDNPTIEEIRKIASINVDEGLKAAGGADAYVDVVKSFATTGTARADSIEEFFKNSDYKNYTIQVHALKSSARIVGDIELSELAKELEACGNAEDVNTITEKTPGLLEQYRKLVEELAPIFEDSSDKPLIDDAMLKDGLMSMYESLMVFDMDMADDIMAAMDEYSMPDDFKEDYAKIKVLMTEVERDGIIELLKNALGIS